MPQGHSVSAVIYDLFFFCFFEPFFVYVVGKLLADKGYVGVSLQSDFKSQMTCDPAHYLANMPVFDIGTAICTQVAYLVGKSPCSGMKAERYCT